MAGGALTTLISRHVACAVSGCKFSSLRARDRTVTVVVARENGRPLKVAVEGSVLDAKGALIGLPTRSGGNVHFAAFWTSF